MSQENVVDHSQLRKLFLDDVRPAPDASWVVVRSYAAFIAHIKAHGVPDVISFDHDLGTRESGYDCARWLIEHRYRVKFWRVHSMNPVGRENIRFVLAKHGEEILK